MARSCRCSGLTRVVDLTSARRKRRSVGVQGCRLSSGRDRTRTPPRKSSEQSDQRLGAVSARPPRGAGVALLQRELRRNKKLAATPTSVPIASIVPGSGSDLGSGLCQPSQSRFEHWRPMMYLDFDSRGANCINAHQYPCLFHPSRKTRVRALDGLRPSRCCDPFPMLLFLH